MTKEIWEYISIGLEIAAFFFVTTDLYGENRILYFQKRLRSISIQHAWDWIMKIMGRTTIIILIATIIEGFVIVYLYIKLTALADNHSILNNHHAIKLLLIILFSLLGCFAATFIVFILFFIGIGIMNTMLRVMIYLIKSKPIKNLMLPIGVVLFLISKIISIILVSINAV